MTTDGLFTLFGKSRRRVIFQANSILWFLLQEFTAMSFVWRFCIIRRITPWFNTLNLSRLNWVSSKRDDGVKKEWNLAIQHLDKARWHDRLIRVTASRHTSVQMPKEGRADLEVKSFIKYSSSCKKKIQ